MFRRLYQKFRLYFKYKDWFKAYDWLLRLGEDLERIKTTQKEQEGHKDSFKFVAYFLFIKSYLTFKAIRFSCKEGFGFDSAILSRTLLENIVNLLYISQNPQKNSELFLKFEAIQKKKLMDTIEKNPEWFKESMKKAILENKQTILKDYKAFKPLYPKIWKGWAQKSIMEMIRETEQILEPLYSQLSYFTHPSTSSIRTYMEGIDNLFNKDVSPRLYPTEELLYEILPTSYTLFLMVLERFNNIFSLGQENKLEEAKQKRDKIWDKYKNR